MTWAGGGEEGEHQGHLALGSAHFLRGCLGSGVKEASASAWHMGTRAGQTLGCPGPVGEEVTQTRAWACSVLPTYLPDASACVRGSLCSAQLSANGAEAPRILTHDQ